MKKGKKWFALLMVVVMLLTSVGRAPVVAQAAKLKTVTVSTQAELEAALKNVQVGEIIISTKSKVTLTIPESKKSNNKSLVVKAANATLVNNGSFKAITIEASKKFTENGKGNEIVINEKKADFTVSSTAEVKALVSNGADSKLTFEKGASLDQLTNNGKGADIKVAQDVKISKATLKGEAADMTLAKGATIQKTVISGKSANLTVEKGATIKALDVKKEGAAVNVVADGKVSINVREKADLTVSGKAKSTTVNIDKKAEGTELEASTAIKLVTKADVDITLKEGAEKSTLKATEKGVDVALKNETKKSVKIETTEGTVTVEKGKEVKKEEKPTPAPVNNKPTPTPVVTTPSTGGNNNSGNPSTPTSTPTPTRVPVDKNGFDAKGRMVAYFGTPSIDGTVDKAWENAVPVTVKDAAGKTDTTAEFKAMWDDSAIYILAKVKDSALDATNGSVYQKDSVEMFLDEKYDRTKDFGVDDLQFRINYKNEQSADRGDLSKLYSATQKVSDGYIVEARIALSEKLAKNNQVYGLELQINDAKGGSRIAVLNLFDKTGKAYENTALFGGLLLEGKTANSISGLNPYDLMTLVNTSKKIMLERYSNGAEVKDLIAKAEAAFKDTKTTQTVIDDLYAALSKAVDNLKPDGKDYDEKECREIPVKYKTTDNYKGTIERVNYTTKNYDVNADARAKDFLVYLPHGYNATDKTKKYNVLYLLHGYGENQNTVFGGPGQNTEMMKILDNMIHDGKLEPMIIVTPTYSYNGAYDFNYIGRFHNELVNDIMTLVESKYNTYAASTSEKDLIASREHRALAGFSMGSMTTWNTFLSRVEYFKYYMPISGAIGNDGGAGEFVGTSDDKTAMYLESVIKEAGFGPNDVSIFCATGTEDFASGGMVSLVNAMKKYDDTFIYSANLNKGNFYFLNGEGGTHAWNSVNKYLYNVLPDMFNTKKITLDTPSPIAVGTNGLDADGHIVANYATPNVDGVADDSAWKNAAQFSAVKSAKTPVEAKFKMLWDDRALYILAEVKDNQLDGSGGNVYDRDSVEILLDENNDKTVNYGMDDLHFRVSFDNKQSADNGDLRRLYTKTSIVPGGYVVEARIELTGRSASNKVYGIDLSVNDGNGGKKVGQIAVFDQNNEAYKDTSKFGAVILSGKTRGALSGFNPYNLLNAVEEGKEIKLERYTDGDVVKGLLLDADAALKNKNQREIGSVFRKLRNAMDNLKPNGKSYDEKECRTIPMKYKTVDEQQGKVERVTYITNSYDAKNEVREKDFLVYLPYGYNAADKSKKYDILYLLHGFGENQNTVFGGPGQNTEMMKVIDNMIKDGKLKPMIIVTPTYSYKGVYNMNYTGLFYKELTNDIMPLVEKNYNTYAETPDAKGFKDSRVHRALGGFSMGSMTTWATYTKTIDYFKYFMPMSAGTSKSTNDVYEGTGEYLASIVKNAGYTPNDVSIFCATGTEDMAYGGMASLTDDMKKVDDTFIYSADLSKGNFYFMSLKGGTHTWNCINRYLYNMLPDLFNNKSIDLTKVPVRTYINFDKNDGSGLSMGARKVNSTGFVKLPGSEVKMNGAEIVGWSTTPDYKDIVTPEADGTYKVAKDMKVLYAVWKWSKPSVACAVSAGAISVNTAAKMDIKLSVGVSGSAISVVSGSAISVVSGTVIVATPGAIGVTGGVIIAGANADFTLYFAQSVSNITSNYYIQYTAVDVNVSDLSSAVWDTVTFTGDKAVINVPISTNNRKIYIRVSKGTGCKFFDSDPVLLEIK